MWSIGLTKNAGNWTWVSGRSLTICKWGKGEQSGENDAAFIYKRSSHGEQGVFGSGGRIWGQTYICEISTGKLFFLSFWLFCFFVFLCYNIILSKLKDTRSA